MKCLGQLEVQTEDLTQEQAPSRLASQLDNQEMAEPLTYKNLNTQPASEESHSSTETAQIPTEDSTECNSSNNQKQDGNQLISTQSHSTTNSSTNQSPAERSPKSLLSNYREIIKVRCQIEKKVRITTREYLHAAYPGIKNIPPRGFKAKIEFQSRARFFWESGIPELMKRAEEIWLELGDEW